MTPHPSARPVGEALGASPTSGDLVATCVRTDGELERLGPEWGALFDRVGCDHPFLSFEWMAEWWAHWSDGRQLFVIAVRHPSGRLVALAPFSIAASDHGILRLRRLAFLGDEQAGSEYLDVLVEPGIHSPAIAAIAHAAVSHRRDWDYIELGSGSQDSATLAELRRQLAGLAMSAHLVKAVECPYTALPGSFETYLAGLSPNVRRKFRRYLRMLEREGPLRLVKMTGAEVSARFDEFVRLHHLRLEQRGQASAFLEPTVQAFHAGLLQRAASSRAARLYFLELKGIPVAALYGFSVGGRLLFYQSGIDPAWARFSVGLVLIGTVIAEAIRAGYREFDFLRGSEAYKFQWATAVRRIVTVRLFDRRLRSQCALAGLRLGGALARIKAIRRRLLALAFWRARRGPAEPPPSVRLPELSPAPSDGLEAGSNSA